MFQVFLVVATLALLPMALSTVASVIADMLAVAGFLLKLPYWLMRGLIASARHRWALVAAQRRQADRDFPRRGPHEYRAWLEREFRSR